MFEFRQLINTKYSTGVVIAVALVLAVSVFLLQYSSAAQSGTVKIILTEDGYNPEYVLIKKGSVVEFSTEIKKPHWPASNLHPSHGIYPEFDSTEPIGAEDIWSFTFDRVGVWHFHDHLRSYYDGYVEVVE